MLKHSTSVIKFCGVLSMKRYWYSVSDVRTCMYVCVVLKVNLTTFLVVHNFAKNAI